MEIGVSAINSFWNLLRDFLEILFNSERAFNVEQKKLFLWVI